MRDLKVLAWIPFESPEQERAFRRAYDQATLPLARIIGVLGMGFTIAFAWPDSLVITQGFESVLLVRALILIILGAAVWSSYQRWGERHQRLFTTAAVVGTTWGFGLICAVADEPQAYIVLSTMMMLVFLCALIRPGIAYTLVGCILTLVPMIVLLAIESTPYEMWVLYLAFTANFLLVGLVAAYLFELSARRVFLAERGEAAAQQRTESLLRNALPGEIADRLRAGPASIADSIDSVSVVFADIAGFTALSTQMQAEDVVTMLDDLFGHFDTLCDRHGLEKIKTIGDAYMAVAGAPMHHPDPAAAAAEFALDLIAAVEAYSNGTMQIRVGIHSGPVVAGVIGRRRFAYDLWGDTVNTASRMESHGVPGEIQVSEVTFALLRDRYQLTGPTRIALKGIGERPVYRLIARREPAPMAAG